MSCFLVLCSITDQCAISDFKRHGLLSSFIIVINYLNADSVTIIKTDESAFISSVFCLVQMQYLLPLSFYQVQSVVKDRRHCTKSDSFHSKFLDNQNPAMHNASIICNALPFE